MWKDLRKSAALYGRATDWKSLATGFKGRSTLERTRRELSLAKVSAVMEFIKAAIETSGKVVVFGYHKEAIGKIQERLTKLGIKSAKITGDVPQYSRQAEVDAFQTKEDVMVFLGQYQAAGVGITLTASNRVIFIEPDWTPAIMEQAEDRTHRIGQTKGVYCQYLVYADSIECEVVKAAVKKQDVIDQTLATVEGKGRQGGDVERKEVLEWI
jgi:SWI/SNF-related matrix-associated actin-dependent regulator 1 of chromatin subfamily A